MQVNSPRVSIVMPTYNRSALLSRAIESVRMQTFTDWELVVTDDASTDGTWRILQEFAAKDVRIKPMLSTKNDLHYIAGILNSCLARAQGEYVARLDDDDIHGSARLRFFFSKINQFVRSEERCHGIPFIQLGIWKNGDCQIVGVLVIYIPRNAEKTNYFSGYSGV